MRRMISDDPQGRLIGRLAPLLGKPTGVDAPFKLAAHQSKQVSDDGAYPDQHYQKAQAARQVSAEKTRDAVTMPNSDKRMPVRETVMNIAARHTNSVQILTARSFQHWLRNRSISSTIAWG